MWLTLLARAQAASFAIVHATVLPVSGPPIADGTVVVTDGKIAAVGAGVAVPAGIETIDATGMFLMPGIIDIHSHMGVYPWPDANAHGDGNEAVEAFTPRAWAGDGFDAEDPAIPRARAGGVTTIQVLPGSANLIGGQSAVVKLRPAVVIEPMLFEGAPRGIKMAVGENPKRVYGGVLDDDQIQTRMGLAAALRAEFQAALDYREARKRKEPPPKDLDLEVLLDVIDDKIRVHLHCYRTHDIDMFFRVADEFGFKVASLQHALEAYKVRDILVAHGTGLATFADWWGFKMEAWDAIPQNAPLVSNHRDAQGRGVPVAIHSDSASHVQRLNLEAAKMLRYGMTEIDALESITLDPARMLGIDARVGSIEVGKDADLALFDKHPFDVYGRAQRTWIDGTVVYDRRTEGTPDGIR
ncbi:MAG: amidohydrolase [Pseudomonadota bacterium]|nr:amidohydrolase [Pseudomonadota bacterium]